MKNAEQCITLYNSFMDNSTGYDRMKRSFITGVSVLAETKVSVDKSGLSNASTFTIRIPEESAPCVFLTPAAFAATENKDGFFTLGKGDIIVLGCAEEENPRPGDLEKRYGTDYSVTIIGVTDNRGKRGSHWKVVCA